MLYTTPKMSNMPQMTEMAMLKSVEMLEQGGSWNPVVLRVGGGGDGGR